MDKAQELRRGTSGVSVAKGRIKQSQAKFFSGLNNGDEGDILSSDNSKKEKLRRLSFIGIANQNLEDMDTNLLDRDDETVGSSRKYKLPKKFLNDCDGVDQASVPRKLRSAMKKRSGDSLSPSPQDLKKVKATVRGIESLKSEDVKKSKLSMKRRSLEEKPSGLVDSEQITKDEEEVVETLYALAGMFPTSDANGSSKMESESLVNLETKGSPTSECEDSPVKGKLQPNIPAMYPEAANFESTLGKETVSILSLNETCVQEQSDISKTNESACEIELQNSDTALIIRHFRLHKQPDTSSSMRKPVIPLMQEVMPIGSLLQEQKVNKGKKKNSSVLWPGLSPPVLQDAGGSYQPKSYVNAPYQLDPTFIGPQFGTEENCSGGKVSRLKADGKSWKKCAAHIYISRLISTLQESKDSLPLLNQSIPRESSKQGNTMAAKRVRNGLNEVASENNMAGKYSKDSINGISHLKQLNQDPLQKQSFDFLSLSTKVGGLEASSGYNNSGITLEPMTQLHFPRLYSVGQQSRPPFSLLHAHHSPGNFPDQLSLSSAMPQQVKLPQHHGRQISSQSHPSSTASTKGQQWLCAAELAARYRPVETTTSNGEVQCWLNGRNFYFSSFAPSTISGNSSL